MYSTSFGSKSGKFILVVKEANLIHDTEVFGKMDPYCLIKVGGLTKKTKVHNNGGKKPRWGEVSKNDSILSEITNFII